MLEQRRWQCSRGYRLSNLRIEPNQRAAKLIDSVDSLCIVEFIGKHSIFAPRPPWTESSWHPLRNKTLTNGEIHLEVTFDSRNELMAREGLSDANREMLDLSSYRQRDKKMPSRVSSFPIHHEDAPQILLTSHDSAPITPVKSAGASSGSLTAWYRKLTTKSDKRKGSRSTATSPVGSPIASPVGSPSTSPTSSPRGSHGLTGAPLLGISLSELIIRQRFSNPDLMMPLFFQSAIARIRECDGTKTEGIFRIAGNAVTLKTCLSQGTPLTREPLLATIEPQPVVTFGICAWLACRIGSQLCDGRFRSRRCRAGSNLATRTPRASLDLCVTQSLHFCRMYVVVVVVTRKSRISLTRYLSRTPPATAAETESPSASDLKQFVESLPPCNQAVLQELLVLASEIVTNIEHTKVRSRVHSIDDGLVFSLASPILTGLHYSLCMIDGRQQLGHLPWTESRMGGGQVDRAVTERLPNRTSTNGECCSPADRARSRDLYSQITTTHRGHRLISL